MSSYKELFKNVSVLLISRLSSSFLTFLLVPFYTTVLSTEDYGKYDITYTTIILLSPLLTICITEGANRFLLDKDASKENICKKCLSITNSSIAIVVTLTIVNSIFHLIPVLEEYAIFFVLFYIAYTYSIALTNIARGLDKLKDIAISGAISSAILIILNILFLLVFKMGISGYFLATIISNGVSAIYLLVKSKIYPYIFSFGYFSKPKEKELIKYSRPLMLNSLSWWINDASDRYFVTYMCGAAANGIYSVAYKIPSVLSIFNGIFNQAWLISVTKEYKQNKNIDFVKKTLKLYSTALILACSLLIVFNKIIARFLYSGDFYEAWKYAPFLLVSVVFAATGSAISMIFGAEKNSKAIARTTAIGAVINIVLNFILISYISVIGAAIATVISNIVVWVVRTIYSRKYIKLDFGFLEISSLILLITQASAYCFLNNAELYVFEITMFTVIIILNRKTIAEIFKSMTKKRQKR